MAAPAAPTELRNGFDHDVFIVHAADDAPFVNGELLPMLNLAGDRGVLSSALPFPAFTEQAIAEAVQRSRFTIAVVSPAYLRDRWTGFAELLSRNVHDDGRGGSLVPLLVADCDVPAIYVIGPSGSGKSSLIAAGVVPRVGDIAGARFAVRTMRPGEHPAQRLVESLGGAPGNLADATGRLLAEERRDRLLVFVDQLEELFTLADADERDRFVRALRVLRADRRCHLIAALRADFYGALMSSELWPDIEGRFTRLEVAPLRGDALRRAIEAPALSAGVYLERDLVERLMSDTAAELPTADEALKTTAELSPRLEQRLARLAGD